MEQEKEYYAFISYKQEVEKKFEGKKHYPWPATRMGVYDPRPDCGDGVEEEIVNNVDKNN